MRDYSEPFDRLAAPVIERLRELVEEHVRLKYYAARRVWPIRRDITPSGASTWGDWFEKMFHERLADFVARAKDENLKQRVMEWEIEQYGHSSLSDESPQT